MLQRGVGGAATAWAPLTATQLPGAALATAGLRVRDAAGTRRAAGTGCARHVAGTVHAAARESLGVPRVAWGAG